MSEPEAVSELDANARFVRGEWESTLPYDPELMRLVNLINALETAEIGVTLHVKGCVVSGMLISMVQFYRLLIKDLVDPARLGEQSDLKSAEAFAEFFRPSLQAAEKTLEEYRQSEDFVLPTPRHLHIRFAQTMNSAQQFTQTLWRARIGEVDGWSTGNFGTIPPLPAE